jgi:hypothetical protein
MPEMKRLTLAIGPAWRQKSGSWQWLGEDLGEELSKYFDVTFFAGDKAKKMRGSDKVLEQADAILCVKHFAAASSVVHMVRRHPVWKRRKKVVYCPIDQFSHHAEILASNKILRCFNLIVTHCHRATPIFEKFAPVRYINHHAKYFIGHDREFPETGYVLWVGTEQNLPAIVNWHNSRRPEWPLVVLTSKAGNAAHFGFEADNVVTRRWTPERHMRCLAECKAALDVKDDTFWDRTKPPTKAMDYVASGLPLALTAECAGYEYLRGMGLDVPTPDDEARWLSREYWDDSQAFRPHVQALCSMGRVGWEFKEAIEGLFR